MLTFHSLPYDIHYTFLNSISDVKDLMNMLLASRTCYKVYLDHQCTFASKIVQTHVGDNLTLANILRDLEKNQQGSVPYIKILELLDDELVLEFLADGRSATSGPVRKLKPMLSVAELKRIYQIHSNITRIASVEQMYYAHQPGGLTLEKWIKITYFRFIFRNGYYIKVNASLDDGTKRLKESIDKSAYKRFKGDWRDFLVHAVVTQRDTSFQVRMIAKTIVWDIDKLFPDYNNILGEICNCQMGFLRAGHRKALGQCLGDLSEAFAYLGTHDEVAAFLRYTEASRSAPLPCERASLYQSLAELLKAFIEKNGTCVGWSVRATRILDIIHI